MKKKTALITGASRGLGKELAYTFAENKYNLVLHSKESETPIFDDVENKHIRGDLKEMETILNICKILEDTGLDILINNAGIYMNRLFSEVVDGEIEEMIGINLIAPMLLMKETKYYFEGKSGLIVNINSTAGKVGSKGESTYCASKFGLRGFSESIKQEASENGISIIDVYLGAMKTDMTKHRKDWDMLIDPKEAAKTIFQICEGHKTLGVREITIGRKNY